MTISNYAGRLMLLCALLSLSCIQDSDSDSDSNKTDTLYVVNVDSTSMVHPLVGIWLAKFSDSLLMRHASCTLTVNSDKSWLLDQRISGLDSLFDTVGTAPDTLIIFMGYDTIENLERRYTGTVSFNPDFVTFRWLGNIGVYSFVVSVDTLQMEHYSGDDYMWCEGPTHRFTRW